MPAMTKWAIYWPCGCWAEVGRNGQLIGVVVKREATVFATASAAEDVIRKNLPVTLTARIVPYTGTMD